MYALSTATTLAAELVPKVKTILAIITLPHVNVRLIIVGTAGAFATTAAIALFVCTRA